MNEFNFNDIVKGASQALSSYLCGQIDEHMVQQVNNSRAKYILAKAIIITYRDAKPQASSDEIVVYLSKQLIIKKDEAFAIYKNFLETEKYSRR